MAIGLKTGPIYFLIGTGSFLHAFFSTVCYRLEDKRWGSRFPNLMNGLYQGEIQPAEAGWVLNELAAVQVELAAFSPDQVIWEIEDLSKRPPWGDNIAATITDLCNYFVTSDGRQLLEVMEKALRTSIEIQKPIKIQ